MLQAKVVVPNFSHYVFCNHDFNFIFDPHKKYIAEFLTIIQTISQNKFGINIDYMEFFSRNN